MDMHILTPLKYAQKRGRKLLPISNFIVGPFIRLQYLSLDLLIAFEVFTVHQEYW